MKKYGVLLLSVFSLFLSIENTYTKMAADTWASVSRYIAIHSRMDEACWESPASRALVTNGAAAMTPVGDGTYEYVAELQIGASYNYLFFAKTFSTAPDGLQTWTTYYDAVPTSGSIQSSTTPAFISAVDTVSYDPVHYGEIVLGDGSRHARRILTVPTNLNPGDTLYIWNNFSDKPGIPANFTANALDTQTVYLSWDAPYGNWGSSGESFKMADVIAGGHYEIYRSLTGNTGSFVLLDTVAGNIREYYDTDITVNSDYYYVLIACDAYYGKSSSESFTQLCSDTSPQDSVSIVNPIPVIFKVEGFDWNYVKNHGGIVYLTPPGERNKRFPRRYPGAIAMVEIRTKKIDEKNIHKTLRTQKNTIRKKKL